MTTQAKECNGPGETGMLVGLGTHETKMGALVGTGRAALQTEVCQNQLARIGMDFTEERKREDWSGYKEGRA